MVVIIAGDMHRSISVSAMFICIPALSGAEPYRLILHGVIIYNVFTIFVTRHALCLQSIINDIINRVSFA